MFFKKLTVPKGNSTEQIEVVQTWEVRWTARTGIFSSEVREECEIFTDKDTAYHFAESLKNAFGLIRHIGSNTVKVEMGKSI